MADEEYEFKLKRLVAQCLVDKALLMNPDRFERKEIDELEDVIDARMVRWLIDIATQEEPLFRHPTKLNCKGLWWEYVKARWFPDWLLRKFPVKEEEIIAVHKFPELNIPDQALGREFVHLRIVDPEELAKEKEDDIQGYNL